MSGKSSEGAVVEERISRVRSAMEREALDVLLVRGTDRYLNEYVPSSESLRIWISGFTGSMGDVLLTHETAHVFVDGRYYLQADQETDPRFYEVVKVPLGTSIDEAVLRKLGEFAKKTRGLRVGIEEEKVPLELHEKLAEALGKEQATLRPLATNLVERARGEAPPRPASTLEWIPDDATGEPVSAKLARVRAALRSEGASGLLVTRLDEIAWLTNLRGYELDYSSTFRALAWVGEDSAFLFVDPAKVSDGARKALQGSFSLSPEQGWDKALAAALGSATPGGSAPLKVLVDPAGTTLAVRRELVAALGVRGETVPGSSPVALLKSKKNPRELESMVASFRRADAVVTAAQAWLNKKVSAGRPVTEAEFALKVEELFREAGARSLSFRVISAAGANGAVIHYSHPDPTRRIKKGELVLLDTGAYFEPGYATDLTRTFLAGGASAKATPKQKLIFTLVLKASIRGMKARFPIGTTGVALDAIVRAPIWDAGYDFLHGTGHGVGVLVHEFPPRVSTKTAPALEPGHVFSIEPGIYLAGWGGVRIENLVTVVEDKKTPGFLRVKALTFAPLDRRLIDGTLLSADEKAWLRQYVRGKA